MKVLNKVTIESDHTNPIAVCISSALRIARFATDLDAEVVFVRDGLSIDINGYDTETSIYDKLKEARSVKRKDSFGGG